MTTVREIEAQIKQLEKFDVHFIHRESERRLHAKMLGLPEYPFTAPAPENMTANRWRRSRFNPIYSEYMAKILMGDGVESRGTERLFAIRRSYE